MREVVDSRTRPDDVPIPFDALDPIPTALQRAIAAEAIRVNDRYLDEFLERYAICPFSRQGREQGAVSRYVHHFSERSVEPLIARMREIAADPKQVVAQVILPLIEVGPDEWTRFCHRLTALGHGRMGGPDVLAVAPLHPDLPYTEANDEALIPLFRRTPDPTIQWVRLDGLAEIYEGRGKGTLFVDIDAIGAHLAKESRPPLWNRIASTNAAMARRLTLPKVVDLLADIVSDARESYARVLLAGLD